MHNFVSKPLTKSSPLSLEINEEQQPINGTEAHAATERPQSDEYETSSAPMTTPMPSTFAGKMQQCQLRDLEQVAFRYNGRELLLPMLIFYKQLSLHMHAHMDIQSGRGTVILEEL